MRRKQLSLFMFLQEGLEATIRDANPWWRGEKLYNLPTMRRWAFQPVLKDLQKGLTPVVILRGPRQVGKTTLLAQVIDFLLGQNIAPKRIFRMQFDELPQLRRLDSPILDLCHWFSETILQKTFNQAAHDGEQAYIFLDEVQNLPDWAPQIKQLVDMNPVRVLVTGSSALRIQGGRDSLAGRITTIEMGPMFLREIAELRGFGHIDPFLPTNGLGPLKDKKTWCQLADFGKEKQRIRNQTFSAFSERGAYPVAQARPDQPWEQVADFLNETIIQRAIQHDLRTGPKGQKRDEHLLEEVFRLACRSIGQAPKQAYYLSSITQAMHADIGWQRILAYLKFLDATLLIRLIEPLELRLKKRRSAPKICLCDHALRAAWLQEMIPLDPSRLKKHPHLSDLAGHVAESTAGYFFRSINGLDVAHFPERVAEPEVDFILTIGEQRIPIEVKYRKKIDFEDTFGLRSFIEKTYYNAPFGILVTLTDELAMDDPRIISMPLSTLLLLR